MCFEAAISGLIGHRNGGGAINRPAEGSMQRKLGRIIVGHRSRVFLLSVGQCLNCLKHLNWQSLTIFNPLPISSEGILRRIDGFMSGRNLLRT